MAEVFESSLAALPARPARGRALGLAFTVHGVVLAGIAAAQAWQLAAVAPPPGQLVFHSPAAIPVALDLAPPAAQGAPRKQPARVPAADRARLRPPVTQPEVIAPAVPQPAGEPPAAEDAGPASAIGTGPGSSDSTGDAFGAGAAAPPAPPEPAFDPDLTYRVGAPEVTAPIPLGECEPAYSVLARSLRLEGEVVLEGTIGRSGGVEDLRVLSGNHVLADLAAESIRRCRFSPGAVRGQPVRVQMSWTVRFRLR